jgi:molybdopterin-guanine dinucleotide biosynthesis protein A
VGALVESADVRRIVLTDASPLANLNTADDINGLL